MSNLICSNLEIKNNELYSYMHDVFGADVVEIFDISQEFVDKVNKKKNK